MYANQRSIEAPEVGRIPQRILYPVPEVAVLLGVTERYVWDLIARGDLKPTPLGRRRLVHADDLKAFITSLTAEDVALRARMAAGA